MSNPPIPLNIIDTMEGVTPYTNEYDAETDLMFLWTVLCMSGLMTILAIIYAIKSNSMAIVVEATSEFIDTVSFALNLWCIYLCRGKPMKYQETMETRTAILSTILLLMGGIRIGVQSYYQVKCARDLEFNVEDAEDIPCGLIQGRPHPTMVIMVGCIMLLCYIPPFLVLYLRGVDFTRFRPEENINKASALLHCVFDVLLQCLLIIASCFMIAYPAQSVEIDAGISVFLLCTMLGLCGYMWSSYHSTDSHIPPAVTVTADPSGDASTATSVNA